MQSTEVREKQINIRLSDEEADRLDRLATHYGLNVAGVIRMLTKREEQALHLNVEPQRVGALVADVEARTVTLNGVTFKIAGSEKTDHSYEVRAGNKSHGRFDIINEQTFVSTHGGGLPLDDLMAIGRAWSRALKIAEPKKR
jgi:hypothetical protein